MDFYGSIDYRAVSLMAQTVSSSMLLDGEGFYATELAIMEGGVIQSAIDIKRWQQQPPTVVEARPGRCPACGAASCPLGGAIRLQGHGRRERQVWGPSRPDQPPEVISVTARRYRCLGCGVVLLVVPRGVLGRRVYSAAAIGFALALWGLALATAAEVRRRVGPARILGDSAVTG